MHKPVTYLNGALNTDQNLEMLNTFPSGAKTPPEEKQAEKERQSEPASRPGGFQNDPNDPSNPNEVRERHLKKVDRKVER
jgi:hypothetical protein